MPDPLNPFTDEQLDELEKALERSKEVDEAINKAQRAGIELPELRTQNREAQKRLRGILQTYRPGR